MSDIIKVFVSSTYRDLKDHRAVVIDAIRKLDGFMPVGMEDFGARDGHSKAVCLAKLAECDVYLGLIGWYCGTIPNGETLSLTGSEYHAARDRGMSRLAFVADDSLPPPPSLRESDAKFTTQKELRELVLSDRVVSFFNAPDKLATLVAAALTNWRESALAGGVRPGDPNTSDALFRCLEEAIDALATRPTVNVTASGPGAIAIGGNVNGSTIVAGANVRKG